MIAFHRYHHKNSLFDFSTVLLNVPGLIFFVTICVLSGMVLFAYYVGTLQCDVYAAGFIDSSNQVNVKVFFVFRWLVGKKIADRFSILFINICSKNCEPNLFFTIHQTLLQPQTATVHIVICRKCFNPTDHALLRIRSARCTHRAGSLPCLSLLWIAQVRN